MSQKVICPRGHLWDPSLLAGLPPTETPRCPICGDPTPAASRGRIPAGKLIHWCRSNPRHAGIGAALLLLGVALALTSYGWWKASRASREEAAARLAARNETRAHPVRKQEPTANGETLRRMRQAEMELANWRQKHNAIHGELTEAKKQRKDALQQRDEQARDRKTAEDLAQAAKEMRREAVNQRREAARQLVQMHVAAGMRLMERGELPASLLWFAEALRLAQKEKLPEEAHRLRLAAVLAQCPRPAQVWVHEKKVNAVQLRADGRRVLTASVDGAVVVWDATTGRRIGEPLLHMASAIQASLSADGKRVVTAATDMTVHIWDLETGKEAFPALQFMGPIAGLAFSPNGRHFLTVAFDSAMEPSAAELHVWNAATGEALSEQPLGSEISPRPAVFSPDGKQVLTICQDRCARLWDITTEKQVGAAFSHAAPVVQASFSSDGKQVVTASTDGTARVWQTNTGKPITPPLKHGAAVRGAAFRADGRAVLTFGTDDRVRVWNARTGQSVGQTMQLAETVNQAIFSPDGRYVLTTGAEDAARIWDYTTGKKVLPALKHNGPITYAAFTPAGDRVLTLSGQVLRLWDLTASEPPASSTPRIETGLAVFSPDGRRVLRVSGMTGQVYDTEKNKPIGTALTHTNKVSAAAFSADGRRVLTVSHQPNGDELEGRVRVWETETGKPIGETLVHPRSVLQAKLSADGRRVLTACQDQRARLWDADKSALVGVPMEHKENLSRALFTPDGKRILTVDVEGGMRLWDAKAEAVGPTWGHRQAVHHLAFSPDGRQLVTASADGTAHVWEGDTGHSVAETAGHEAAVVYAAFSPDGKRVVTVSDDQRARVWDAGTGKPVTPWLRHRAAVTLGAFSADNRWLMTVAADGVRVWDAATGEPISPLLKHGPEQPIPHGVALGRDGRLVLAVGVPGDPSAHETQEFRADERPADDLLLVAELLSGQRLARVGETTAFDGADLGNAWKLIQKRYEKEFISPPGRTVVWDQRGATECERRQLWAGAVRHLDRIIAHSASADLYARRARANAVMGNEAAARADYSKALEGNAERWDLWAGRAESEAALGRWEQAAADYSKAIERKADQAELWVGRGRAEAEREDWTRAAADLAKAIHLGNTDISIWRQHALALLASGNKANYRRWCERLVQRFGDSKDEAVARRIAWTCALTGAAVRDLKPLVQRAESAVKANPQSPDELRRLAVLLYRDGQFSAALTRLQEITRLPETKPEARDFLLLAMTAQRLGRGDEAKKWLDKAEQTMREQAKGAVSPWQERLVYQLLHREAEAQMKGVKR